MASKGTIHRAPKRFHHRLYMQRSMEISSLRGPWSADPGGTTLSSWIANARYGTCGLTEVRVDGGCKAGATKGVWQPRLQQSTPVAMVAWCLRQCASCQGCKHVTVSHILSECSWFATCDYDNPVAIPKGVSTEMFLSGPAVDSPRLRNDLTSHGKDDHETPDRPDLAGAPASPTDHGDLAELTQHQQPAEMLKFNLPVDRFAPGTFEQAMASVYTMWNLLDRMVLQINNTEPWSKKTLAHPLNQQICALAALWICYSHARARAATPEQPSACSCPCRWSGSCGRCAAPA